jgi:hypothetical protein
LPVKNEVDKYNEDFDMLKPGYKGVTFTLLEHKDRSYFNFLALFPPQAKRGQTSAA